MSNATEQNRRRENADTTGNTARFENGTVISFNKTVSERLGHAEKRDAEQWVSCGRFFVLWILFQQHEAFQWQLCN